MSEDDDSDFNIDESIGTGRRSPMESGTESYANGDAVPTAFDMRDASTYQPMKLLARIELPTPRTVSLHVRANADNSPFDFDGMAQFPVLGGSGAIGTVLIVDYGDMAGRHRVVADLRSGTYVLPAITFAQVNVLTWAETGTLNFGFQASATLSRSQPTNPKPFTYTGAGLIEAAGQRFVPVPYYAQWVDIWANGWAGGIGAANAPILRGIELGLYRDYTTGLFVPPWGPVSLSGDSLDTDSVNIDNAGAAEVRVYCQFYLEL